MNNKDGNGGTRSEIYACQRLTIVAEGRITGRKKADFTKGIFSANRRIKRAIKVDKIIESGTAMIVNRPVFFMARQKNSFSNKLMKFFIPTKFNVNAFSVKA